MNYIIWVSILFSSFISEERPQGTLLLPALFSDHMVLQRDKPISIWGQAEPKQKVSIRFRGDEVQVVADSLGYWQTTLKAQQAGGPYQMSIETDQGKISFKDLLVGDVYLCAGQSNMEWPLSQTSTGAADWPKAKHHNIRLFQIQKAMASQPQDDLEGSSWTTCTPDYAKSFSAIAYYLGIELQKKEDIPIGLIQATWRGSKIKSWLSPAVAKGIPEYEKWLSTTMDLPFDRKTEWEIAAYSRWLSSLDTLDVGKQEYWEQIPKAWKDSKVVDLPQPLDQLDLTGRYGVFWFKKRVSLTRSELQSSIRIQLGPIGDVDETYINGHLVGSTKHPRVKRNYSVSSSLLREGSNEVVVRVKSLKGDGGFTGKAEQMSLKIGDQQQMLAGEWIARIGTPGVADPPLNIDPKFYVSAFYNAMIHPLRSYPMKAIVWYQGEADTRAPMFYETALKDLIKDWRSNWSAADQPWFLIVQLPGFGKEKGFDAKSKWSRLREAQAAATSGPKTALVVNIDLGDSLSIHPLNKRPVARRIANLAQSLFYEPELIAKAPCFEDLQAEEGRLHLHFNTFGSSLVRKSEASKLAGFMIAGKNRKWWPATARLKGDNVIVLAAKEVAQPIAVRYAWSDNPGDLPWYNLEGLPLSPFRSDNWEE